ncbi:hypothetical protein CF116_09400 [Aeromonas veronii]|uniref:3'-5' exonuclease n=1 Tax=Aeromonas veronii TaxID=654 RepID=UPI00111A218D|nr:3'-5' exonuclease [Aeromonas veronii]TNI81191.1 hypothetical protein CF116_09400 [Aeromonas veronii]
MSKQSLIAVVDLETLGKGPRAVIGEIGVVIVDVEQLVAVDEFYCRVSLHQPRQRDEIIMSWWDQQRIDSPQAWLEMFKNTDRLCLADALDALKDFLARHFPRALAVELMGNGPEFDNVILEDAYSQCGIELPWSFRGNQSLRTVVLMGRLLLDIDPKFQIEFEGIRHHALHDARHEATYLISILRPFKQAIGKEVA